MTKKTLHLLALCAVLGTAACEAGPGEPPVQRSTSAAAAASVALLQWTGPMPAQLVGGLTIPVHFRALDGAGKPVAGVDLRFSAGPGHGSFEGASALATTDTAGIARTSWTLGINAGEQKATVTVAGGSVTQTLTLPVSAGAASRPRFVQRSINLAGPICTAEGQTDAKAVFSLLGDGQPAAIRLATIHARTGTFSGLYVGFLGVAPGTARIVGTDIYGRADTLTVTVGNSLPVVSLPDTLRLAVGDSALVTPAISGPCTATLFNPHVATGLYADTVRYNSVALAPELFSVHNRLPFSGHRIVGLKSGTGKVVTRYWGGVDTATVVVR